MQMLMKIKITCFTVILMMAANILMAQTGTNHVALLQIQQE